jgi:ABC-type uncharacterized transport system permease subunit
VHILLVVVFVLPALLYLAAWWRAQLAVRSGAGAAAAGTRFDTGSLLILFGLIVHAGSIAMAMTDGPAILTAMSSASASAASAGATSASGMATGLHFGFAPALSVILWLGVLMLWMESLSIRVEALLAVVLPIAALSALLPLFFPGSDWSGLARQPLFIPHLLVGTLAYGVLMLAALHAGLMMAAERALHGGATPQWSIFARWVDHLPPLLVLERILFRFIGVGFGLLSLTVLSGIVFSEQLFGRAARFDHKTVFTLVAWAVFGVLLIGRSRWGWRGRTALRLTLSGFVVLMLAYVGSRFVLEVILRRY